MTWKSHAILVGRIASIQRGRCSPALQKGVEAIKEDCCLSVKVALIDKARRKKKGEEKEAKQGSKSPRAPPGTVTMEEYNVEVESPEMRELWVQGLGQLVVTERKHAEQMFEKQSKCLVM